MPVLHDPNVRPFVLFDHDEVEELVLHFWHLLPGFSCPLL
jgi:hypothetical protein